MADVTLQVGGDFREFNSSVRKSVRDAERRFAASRFSNPKVNLKNVELPLGRISKSVKDFESSLDAANARVIAFGASVGIIAAVQRSFSALVRQVTEVEKSLTDINVILNQSQNGLTKFASGLFDVARQTGQSFNTVATAATELARQGLGAEETLIRVRDAMILVRLSGGEAGQAVEALTSIINSFSSSVLSSTEIINKLANVDAALATSAAGLAEAIKRTGSTAQDANVTLDETIALVASLQQTTARGETVIGNALKTIFARLQRSTTIDQLQELGVAIDQSQSGIEKLKALGEALDNTDTLTASKIKELAGGVRQINIISAALSDLRKEYSFYNQALEISLSSTDEAIQRNERLNETIAALANVSLTNITELFKQIGDAGATQGIKDILTAFNSFIEKFRDFPEVISVITKGISNLLQPITGPIFNVAFAAIAKIATRVGKDLFGYSKTLLGVTGTLNKQRELQERIANAVLNTSERYQRQLAYAKSLQEQERIILRILEEQAIARSAQASLFAGVAGSQSFRRAAGKVPNLADEAPSKNGVMRFGKILNFADSLPDAVQREIAALVKRGYSKNEAEKLVFVGSDPRVGVGVGNFIDEPSGTIKEGIDKRLKIGKGAFGKYPNFVDSPQDLNLSRLRGVNPSSGRSGFVPAGQLRDLLNKFRGAIVKGLEDDAAVYQSAIRSEAKRLQLEPKSQTRLGLLINSVKRDASQQFALIQEETFRQNELARIAKVKGAPERTGEPPDIAPRVLSPELDAYVTDSDRRRREREAQLKSRIGRDQLLKQSYFEKYQSGQYIDTQGQGILVNETRQALGKQIVEKTGKTVAELAKSSDPQESRLARELQGQLTNFRKSIVRNNEAFLNEALRGANVSQNKIGIFATQDKTVRTFARDIYRQTLRSLPKDVFASLSGNEKELLRSGAVAKAQDQYSRFSTERNARLSQRAFLATIGLSLAEPLVTNAIGKDNPLGGGIGGALKGAAGGASIGLLAGPIGALVGGTAGGVVGGIVGAVEAIGTSVEELASNLDKIKASFQGNAEATAQYISTQGQLSDLIKAGATNQGDIDKLNEKLSDLLFTITNDQLREDLITAGNNFDLLQDALKRFTDSQSQEVARARALSESGQLAENREFLSVFRRNDYSVSDLSSFARNLADTININARDEQGNFTFNIDDFVKSSNDLNKAFDYFGINLGTYTDAVTNNTDTLKSIIANVIPILQQRRNIAERISDRPPSPGITQSLENKVLDVRTATELQTRSIDQLKASLLNSLSLNRQRLGVNLLPESQRVRAGAGIDRQQAIFQFQQSEQESVANQIQGLVDFFKNNNIKGLDFQNQLFGAQTFDDLKKLIENVNGTVDLRGENRQNLADIRRNIDKEATVLRLRESAALAEIDINQRFQQVLDTRQKVDASFGGNVLGGLSGISGAAVTFNSLNRREVPGNLLRGGQGLNALQELFPFSNIADTDLYRSIQRAQQGRLVREFQAQSAQNVLTNEGAQPLTQQARAIINSLRNEGTISNQNLAGLPNDIASIIVDIKNFGDQLQNIFTEREAFEKQSAEGIATLVGLATGGGLATRPVIGNIAGSPTSALNALGGTKNILEVSGRLDEIRKAETFLNEEIARLRELQAATVNQRNNAIDIQQNISREDVAKFIDTRRRGTSQLEIQRANELGTNLTGKGGLPTLTGLDFGFISREIADSYSKAINLNAEITGKDLVNAIIRDLLNSNVVSSAVENIASREGSFLGVAGAEAVTPEGLRKAFENLFFTNNADLSKFDDDIQFFDTTIKFLQNGLKNLSNQVETLRNNFAKGQFTDEDIKKLDEATKQVDNFGKNLQEASDGIEKFIVRTNNIGGTGQTFTDTLTNTTYSFTNNRASRLQAAQERERLLRSAYQARGEGILTDDLGQTQTVSGDTIRSSAATIAQEAQGLESLWAGFRSEIFRTKEELANFGEIGANIATSLSSNFSQAFGDFVVGAKSGEEAFRSFVGTVLAEVARMFAARAIAQLVNAVVGGLTGGGGGTGPSTGTDAGIIRGGGGFAQGYIPNLALGGLASSIAREQASISQGIGGAGPSAQPRVLQGVRMPNGSQTIVANNQEVLVKGYNGSPYDAVFNRDMVHSAGGMAGVSRFGKPYKIAAGGITPDTTNSNSYGNINVITNVNVQSDGTATSSTSTRSDKGDTPENYKRLAKVMEGIALRTIQTELRPGGSLSGK